MPSTVITLENGTVKKQIEDIKYTTIKHHYLIEETNSITIWQGYHNSSKSSFETIIFLPIQIDYEDYKNLTKFIQVLNQNSPISIYNFYNIDDEVDYDYTSNTNNGKEADINATLMLFYREKNYALREEEKELLSNYRTFDIERILTDNSGCMPISCFNSGLIIISENGVISSPINKESHTYQAREILEKMGIDTHGDNSLEDIVFHNVVIAQLLYKDIIFWINPPINTYQICMIKKIIDDVKKLSLKHKISINIGGEAFYQTNYLVLNDSNEVLELLNKISQENLKR